MNALAIIVGIILLLYGIDGCKKGLVDGLNHIIAGVLGLAVIYILIKGVGNFAQKSYINVLIALILLVAIRITYKVLKLITDSLEIATKLPVVGWVNHILGIVIGLVRGIFFCWLLIIIIEYFNVPLLKEWIQLQVTQNVYLEVIYKTNLLVQLLLIVQ